MAAPAWAELPREITAAILQNLEVLEIPNMAQVCREWRSVCEDPSMWRRHIHLRKSEKICRYAVDRSQGQLIGISIEWVGTDELMHHISQSCSQLRHLRLVRCVYISSEGLIAALNKFPLLEELHLYCLNIDTVAVIEAVGTSCPQLKNFELCGNRSDPDKPFDADAQAIAENMPQLCHLKLWGNKMTNNGLQAILDACPHLESIDMERCYNVPFGGLLSTQRIKDLRRGIL